MLSLTLAGVIGSDASKYEADNMNIISFSVATHEKYKNKKGDLVESTTWVKCVMFEKKDKPRKVFDFLKAKTKVVITGKPDFESWICKNDGDSKGNLKCLVEQIELMN